jgi:hypothetical protein
MRRRCERALCFGARARFGFFGAGTKQRGPAKARPYVTAGSAGGCSNLVDAGCHQNKSRIAVSLGNLQMWSESHANRRED